MESRDSVRSAPLKGPARHRAQTGRAANCFDTLRLFAALCVVVQHATTHFRTEFLWYRSGSGLWFLDGVALFFIISGGMVYASAEKCYAASRPWRDYLRNRLLRVAPALYAFTAIALMFLVGSGVVGTTFLIDPQLLIWLLSNLLFVPVDNPRFLHGFGVGVINGSLWTIPVEVSFYLVVPALVWLAERWSFKGMVTIGSAVAVSGATAYALAGGADADSIGGRILGASFLPWLGFFLMGVGWGRWWDRAPQSGVFATAAVILYAAGATWRQTEGPRAGVLITLLAGLPLSYVVMWFGYRGPAILHNVSQRLGDLSFGTYIWHMPVINVMIWSGALVGNVRGTGLVAVAVATTLACAYLSWHLVERPSLRLKAYSARDEIIAVPRADLRPA